MKCGGNAPPPNWISGYYMLWEGGMEEVQCIRHGEMKRVCVTETLSTLTGFFVFARTVLWF